MKMFLWIGLLAMFASTLAAAEPGLLLGSVIVRGSASLNGRLAASNALNLGNGDRLRTGPGSGALVTISDGDMLTLGENGGVILVKGPKGVAAEFERGRVQVTTNHGRLSELHLPGQSVSVRAGSGLSHYQISRVADSSYIYATKGSVFIVRDDSGGMTEVREGMVGIVRNQIAARVAPPSFPGQAQQTPPAAGGQRAGRVSASIPADYVLRGPTRMDAPTGADILLNDMLKTGSHGRMRLSLDDGSILTVGSDTQLQVLEHNTQSQQTSMEMLYGKMRAQVIKQTAPGAKFEIRTATAVCGVLGTDFYLEATPTSTRVIVFQGIVRITPLLAGAAAGISIAAGQMGTSSASTAASPVAATATQIQVAVIATTATQVAAQTAATGVATAASAASRVTVIAATAAPAAAVAAISVPAFTQDTASKSTP